MGYTTLSGRHSNTVEIDLSPDGPVTANGKSRVIELHDRSVARLTLDVASVSSDDDLDVTIEVSSDGSTWYDSGAFTQASDQGSEQKLFMLDRFVRADFEVTGSDVSIVFTLKGEAV